MDRYVIITGASAGIGYELAKLFAKDRYNLILVARGKERLNKAKEELKKYNIDVKTIATDISNIDGCTEIIDYVNNNNINVEVLINNAGIGTFGYYSDIEWEKEQKLININILALSKLTNYFLKQMVNKNNGRILNVASTAGFSVGPKMASYYASKAYVLNLTEAIAEEVNGTNVKVSCLCPGPVKTGFQEKAGIKKSDKAKKYLMSAEDVAKIAYKDFNKGKVIIIPGIKNKILVFGNKLLPRKISRKIILSTNKK